MALSPFGQGEVCYRDFEIPEFGVAMIKPNMDIVNTEPNPYIANETYISVELDWKNLNETVIKMLDNPNILSYIIDNSRTKLVEMFSYHNVGRYWYDFFASLNGLEHE